MKEMNRLVRVAYPTEPSQTEPYTPGKISALGETTYVLMQAMLSPDKAKELLRFIPSERPSEANDYRYDLFLYPKRSDWQHPVIRMKVTPSRDMGVGQEAYQEVEWSQRTADKEEAVLLRTGYIHIDDSVIRDIRPTDVIQDSSLALRDLLKANFPNHEIAVQDLDLRDSGFGYDPR